jgi:hypothetical protein
LDSVFISIYLKNAAPKCISEIAGTNIYSGKKTNQVYLAASRMNLAQNVTMTAFAPNVIPVQKVNSVLFSFL